MKNGIAKLLTAALAAFTVAGMSITPVFAANTIIPEGENWVGSDHVDANPNADPPTNEVTGTAIQTISTITVTDLSKADSLNVTAYQIVKGVYKDGRLAGYKLCDLGKDPEDETKNLTIADIEKPDASEITAIAKNINEGKSSLTGIEMSRDAAAKSTYTANVEAGLYIVLARGDEAVVYNPAVVAVNVLNAHLISENNQPFVEPGEVSMGPQSYFNYPAEAYLKSSESGFDKKITGSRKPGSTDTAEPVNAKGDTVAFGDIVDFKIDSMTIPSYSDEYKSVRYVIKDTLDKDAFKGINDFVLTVDDTLTPSSTEIPAVQGGQAQTVNNYTLEIYDADGTKLDPDKDGDFEKAVSFKVAFTDEFIRAHGTNSVEITYSSEFLDTAGLNYAENNNHAELEYSNNPEDEESVNKKYANTYHYTFGIDADIDAQDGTGNKETYELNKVTQALSVQNNEEFEDGSNAAGTDTKKSTYALPGATFGLYSNENMTDESSVAEAVSDTNGHISFRGLDEGVYYLKEIHAPRGYTLNENVYKITITAEIDAAGLLTSYSITTELKIQDTYMPAGQCIYTNTPEQDAETGAVTNNITDDTIAPVEIIDPEIASLPSTGGIGTIVITIAAAIGMAGFLTLFLYNRKKRKDEADRK